MEGKPRKFKVHFNRINMQRGNPNVWSVHFSGQCIQARKVIMRGEVESVFMPDGQQPRAYFRGRGTARVSKHGVVVVEAVGA